MLGNEESENLLHQALRKRYMIQRTHQLQKLTSLVQKLGKFVFVLLQSLVGTSILVMQRLHC